MSDFDLAAICAHPDDAELTMGGTLAFHAARGRRVALVDLTRGEAGSRGTPETRQAEAAEAARILKAAHRESLGLPDAALEVSTAQKDPIVEAIRRLRPRVVLLQHSEQRHPDHSTAGRLVYEAAFLSGLRNYKPELGAAFRPFKLVYALRLGEASDLVPTVVFDITPFWEVKLAAVRAFTSQFTPEPGETVSLALDRFEQLLDISARRNGQRIGARYGEGFIIREPFLGDDLAELPVPSF
ncbi:MAG: bacillithiol biosynthesis deacetylase BshB1 [Vicinamibacteria bacterium]|jgi:bacillithiol biosynthesis deacetylase BshB1|nr:bacillithiol biosynthesis deacetylase BshB1 [Vicinamibacteria bacterium]